MKKEEEEGVISVSSLGRHGMAVLLEQETGSGNGSSLGGAPYGSEAGFDTNMVIILAALLCALVCALGLNSIVRCALRCRGEPEERAAAAARGLKKSALRKIPVASYGGAGAGGAVGSDCTICLGEFVAGERVRVLPRCSHGFHVRCIDPWLASHSSCPTCRRSLLVSSAADDAPPPPPNNAHHVAIELDEVS